MTEEKSVQEHPNYLQKILTDLLNIGEKVEEKTRTLVLLASLSSLYESLMTTLLVGKSTIKMDEVTTMIVQKEVLRRETQLQAQAATQLWWFLKEQEATDKMTGDRGEGGPSPR